MSAPMTREERTQRLADLRARMAARNVTLSGGPLMSLPLHRRIAFAISDPGAITPRGDDYREPVHVWQARAVAFVVPESAEVDALRARVAELEAAPSPATVLRQVADKWAAHCPEHSDAEDVWMDCPEDWVFELRRAADDRAEGGAL